MLRHEVATITTGSTPPRERFPSSGSRKHSVREILCCGRLWSPYSLPKDVFCLREKRMVNGYRRISLANHDIVVPGVPLRQEVEVHCIPDIVRQVMEVRIWWRGSMVQSQNYPLKEFPRVHF